MTWYRIGTVAVTSGSAVVTGTGTAFVAHVKPGDAIQVANGALQEVLSVQSDTQLTLTGNYPAATQSGQSYSIVPVRGYVRDLAISAAALVQDFSDMRDDIIAGAYLPLAGGTLTGMTEIAAAGAELRVRSTTTANATIRAYVNGTESGKIAFSNGGSLLVETVGTERLRVTNSGRVGIGTNAPARALDVVGDMQASGIIYSTGSGGGLEMAWLGATSRVLSFDRAAVASRPLQFSASDLTFAVTTFRMETDNIVALGTSAKRWSTVYAGTSTINTSDEREKVWRGGLTSAELTAAEQIADELGFYQWTDAVAEKGAANARYHYGARAQRVWQIMHANGLLPMTGTSSRYAFLCYDQWPAVLDDQGDEVEPAGDRYGLRTDQLALFLTSALFTKLKALS
jgi:hypothetical protein